MDVIYQLIFERWIYPLELLIVAIVLAIVPYVLVRDPVSQLAQRFRVTRDKPAVTND
jgi:hypothetical protein